MFTLNQMNRADAAVHTLFASGYFVTPYDDQPHQIRRELLAIVCALSTDAFDHDEDSDMGLCRTVVIG